MMARTIPEASEMIFPDTDHYAMWENPALFNRAVPSFLAGQTQKPNRDSRAPKVRGATIRD
jgi:hypothetical protein